MGKKASEVKGPNEAAASPDGWKDVTTERPYYAPESCSATPLQGYILQRIAMPEGKYGPWIAFVVRTTAPVLALPVGKTEPVEVPAGSEVVIKESVRLTTLARFLMPDKIIEVRIAPKSKIPTASGAMWTFEITANERTIKARPPLHALLPPIVATSAPGPKPPPDDGIPF